MNIKEEATAELKRVLELLESGSHKVLAVKIRHDVTKTGLPEPDTVERNVLEIAYGRAVEDNPEGYDDR